MNTGLDRKHTSGQLKRGFCKILSLMLVLFIAITLSACDDKADEKVTLPSGFSLTKPPMEILGDSSGMPGAGAGPESNLIMAMGLSTLAYIINLFGIMSAVTIIVASLVTLLVVNYPKTVAQTKQKIVHVLFSVILMASLPLIMDCILSLLVSAIH